LERCGLCCCNRAKKISAFNAKTAAQGNWKSERLRAKGEKTDTMGYVVVKVPGGGETAMMGRL